jgi:hypothetical protein
MPPRAHTFHVRLSRRNSAWRRSSLTAILNQSTWARSAYAEAGPKRRSIKSGRVRSDKSASPRPASRRGGSNRRDCPRRRHRAEPSGEAGVVPQVLRLARASWSSLAGPCGGEPGLRRRTGRRASGRWWRVRGFGPGDTGSRFLRYPAPKRGSGHRADWPHRSR